MVSAMETSVASAQTPEQVKDALDDVDQFETLAKRFGVDNLTARISVWRIDLRRKRAVEPDTGGRGKTISNGNSLTSVERHRDRQLAAVPESEWQEIRQKAIESDKPVFVNSMVNRVIKQQRQQKAAADPPPIPTGTYSLVLADPPWQYDFAESSTREIENQYPTLPVAEICALSVQPLFADDCLLFLWATSPKLREALQVMETWGFDYVTNAVWVKDKIGMGYYFRQQHELLLVGRKGNPPQSLPETRVSSVFEAPRTQHSVKPAVVHKALEQMYPNFVKLELFARQPRLGWKSWGNEVE